MGYTEWVNPNPHPAVLDLCANANAKIDQPARITFTVPPKGTRMSQDEARKASHLLDRDSCVVATRIPDEYDNAIRKERDGKVVGGLAPFLLKLNEYNPPVQAVLIPAEQARIEAEQVMKDASESAFIAETTKRAAEAQANRAQSAISDAQLRATEALVLSPGAGETEETRKLREELEASKLARVAAEQKATDAEKARVKAEKGKERAEADAQKALDAATAPGGTGEKPAEASKPSGGGARGGAG